MFQVMIRTPSDPGIPYVHEIRSVAPSDTGMMMLKTAMVMMVTMIMMMELMRKIDLDLVLLIFSLMQECTPAWPEM